MDIPINPFKYRDSLDISTDAEIIIKRKELEQFTRRYLLKGEYVSIIGPRQIGKTTFLKQLPYVLKPEFLDCLYFLINLQICKDCDLKTMYKLLCHAMVDVLSPPLKEKLKKFSNPSTGEKFKEFIKELCFHHKEKVILALDDFEYLSFSGRGNAYDLLSCFCSIWAEHDFNKFSIIISGCTHLYEFSTAEGSPYFRIAQPINIEEFTEEETRKLGYVFFQKTGQSFNQEIIDLIYRESRGFPSLIQKIFHYLYDYVRLNKCNINPEITAQIIQRIIEEWDSKDIEMITEIEQNLKSFEIIVKLTEHISTKKILANEFDTIDIQKLELSGAIKNNKGYLDFRNPITGAKLSHYFSDSKKAEIYIVHHQLYKAAQFHSRGKKSDPVGNALKVLDKKADLLDMDLIYESVAEIVLTYFEFDRARFYKYREIINEKDRTKHRSFKLISQLEKNANKQIVNYPQNQNPFIIDEKEYPGDFLFTIVENKNQQLEVDPYSNPRISKEILKRFNAKSFLATPLILKNKFLGILITDNDLSGRSINQKQQKQTDDFMKYASLFLNDKRIRELQVIIEFGNTLNELRKMDDIIDHCLNVSLILLPQTDKATFRIRQGNTLKRTKYKGIPPSFKQIINIDNKSITGQVAVSKKPRLINDASKEECFRESMKGTGAELCVPVINQDELIGTLNHESLQKNVYSNADLKLLLNMADQVALALRNAEKFAEADKKLLSLAEIIKTINNTSEPRQVFQLVMDKAMELTQARYGHLYKSIENNQQLKLIINKGEGSPQNPINIHNKGQRGLIGECAALKKSINCGDVHDPKYKNVYIPTIPETISELAIPILINNQLKGVLNLEHDKKDYFDTEKEKLMRIFADHIAVTFNNLEKREEIERVRHERAIRKSMEITRDLSIVISHSLKNKLIWIPAQLDFLKKDIENQKIQESYNHLNRIDSGIQEAIQLILKFSNLYKEIKQENKEELEEIDINEIIMDVLHSPEYNNEPYNKIRINTQYDPNIPEIRGNPELLRHMFGNLFHNAQLAVENKWKSDIIKSGEIIIITRYIQEESFIYIGLEDNGCGITAKNLETIKNLEEPTFSTRKKAGGTGFGIWSSRLILRIFNGKFNIESKENEGTKISLIFPINTGDVND